MEDGIITAECQGEYWPRKRDQRQYACPVPTPAGATVSELLDAFLVTHEAFVSECAAYDSLCDALRANPDDPEAGALFHLVEKDWMRACVENVEAWDAYITARNAA
jgi:hypothetical protein